jgi:hypothetical protein
MIETIRIFIASSSELKEERDEFREFISLLNDRSYKKGVYFKLVQWEHFLDTVSQISKQEDYNEALKESQIVICLFYTKAGKYTQLEFDTALKQFKETGRPLIYTYFKAGAPTAAPGDEQALALENFKKRLVELKHFYTVYQNADNLKTQFRNQLDKLEDQGFVVYQQHFIEKAKEQVTNYFNSKNAIIGSTISAGDDVHVGDTTTNTTTTTGSNNLIIQGATANTITVNVNGQTQEIEKKLDALKAFMEQMSVKSVQSADNIYRIASISNANFGYLVGQVGHDKALPSYLAENLLGSGNAWIQSLRQELQDKQKVSVGSQPWNIFQNYGWLVETFMQKMTATAGQEKSLRRLSFMAEAYQASLRFLCYIQMAQVLQMESKPKLGIISDFIQMEGNRFQDFDYTSLLLGTTDVIGESGFMKEVNKFVEELTDTETSLYGTALYLENHRRKLMTSSIADDATLPGVLNEYLTALVYWLRKLSFIAKYRMVSIKEINLNYSLGRAKNFVHLYGELHGMYSEGGSTEDDYNTKSIEGYFTYNKSILLFRGKNADSGLENIRDESAYLSLSPLVIDQSVYAEKPTQTPEIFYYTGWEKARRQYQFAQYKNELAFGDRQDIASNKSLNVLGQNNNQPRLDDLFEQLEEVFKPLKIK